MNEELRDVLAKYVDAEAVDDMLRLEGEAGTFGPLADRDICFVLLEFTASEESELLAALGSVADLSAEHSAVVDAIVSNLMVVVFGMVGPLTPHKPFVDAVLARHGNGVKVMYAAGPARVGNLGSAKRMSYSFIHPAFSKALALLPSVAKGEARELV